MQGILNLHTCLPETYEVKIRVIHSCSMNSAIQILWYLATLGGNQACADLSYKDNIKKRIIMFGKMPIIKDMKAKIKSGAIIDN